MFQVRRVRVRDASLQTFNTVPNVQGETEGVRVKAETLVDVNVPRESWPHYLSWASVHMNMGVQPARPPGTNLLLLLADEPLSNGIKGGAINGVGFFGGRVMYPSEGWYAFTLGTGDDALEVTFDNSEEAAAFIAKLVKHWFPE